MLYLKKRGFTLIEVLVAIAIVSTITASSYIYIPLLFDRAYDARRKDDLHKLKTSLDIYFDFAGQYPEELPGCGKPLMYKTQNILNSVPCDPTLKTPYYYQILKGDLQSFRIYTNLSNKKDFSISDVGCLGGCGPECFYNYGVSSVNVSLIRCSYVCAPGGGNTGACEQFDDPELSECPKLYFGDSTCKAECKTPKNRCKDSSGKHKLY